MAGGETEKGQRRGEERGGAGRSRRARRSARSDERIARAGRRRRERGRVRAGRGEGDGAGRESGEGRVESESAGEGSGGMQWHTFLQRRSFVFVLYVPLSWKLPNRFTPVTRGETGERGSGGGTAGAGERHARPLLGEEGLMLHTATPSAPSAPHRHPTCPVCSGKPLAWPRGPADLCRTPALSVTAVRTV